MDRFIIDDTDQPPTQDTDVRPYTVPTPLREPIPVAMKETYITELEDQVRELVGSEPKDFARATLLIYDIFRLRDEQENALEISSLFDVPAIVLFQVPPLVRSIHRMDPTPTTATLDAVLERIDDLTRLVIVALEGHTDADVVRRLLDLREAVSAAHLDPGRYETVTAAADHLTHLVNAFFFDRLTAIPALRNYVVGLELGL